jgi:hypothetical protein
MRDLDTVDFELRLLAARCVGRSASMVSSRRAQSDLRYRFWMLGHRHNLVTMAETDDEADLAAWARETHEEMKAAAVAARGVMLLQAMAWQPDVSAKIENGRTRFDVGELLILAAVLDVPPLVLLYPDLPAGDVEIIPNRPGNSFDAYLWATGIAPPFLNPGTPSKGSQLITAVRRRHELMAELAGILVEKSKARDDMQKKSLESQQAQVSGEIGRLNALINDVGGVLNA